MDAEKKALDQQYTSVTSHRRGVRGAVRRSRSGAKGQDEDVAVDQQYWEGLVSLEMASQGESEAPTYMTKVYHMLDGMLRADDGVTCLDDSTRNCQEMQGVLDLLKKADDLPPDAVDQRFEQLIESEDYEDAKAILRTKFAELRAKEAKRKEGGRRTIAEQSVVYKFEHGACYKIQTFDVLDKRHRDLLYDICKLRKMDSTLTRVVGIKDDKDVAAILRGVSPQVCRYWVKHGDSADLNKLMGRLDPATATQIIEHMDAESIVHLQNKWTGDKSPELKARLTIAAEQKRRAGKANVAGRAFRQWRSKALPAQRTPSKPQAFDAKVAWKKVAARVATAESERVELADDLQRGLNISDRQIVRTLLGSKDPKSDILEAAGQLLDDSAQPYDAIHNRRTPEEGRSLLSALDALATNADNKLLKSRTFGASWSTVKAGIKGAIDAQEERDQKKIVRGADGRSATSQPAQLPACVLRGVRPNDEKDTPTN